MHRRAIEHLTSADAVLADLIKSVGPCRLPPRQCREPLAPFVALVEAVAHQQLTGKVAKTILGRLQALFPDREFPSPNDLLAASDDALRGVGFSRAKVASIKDIAAKTLTGVVPPAAELLRFSDEEIIDRLTEIRGVGRWTVEMLLIFELGRLDVLPVDDYGVKKGFAATYRRRALPAPKQLLRHGERWRPYRSVAAWYLWRALELPAADPA